MSTAENILSQLFLNLRVEQQMKPFAKLKHMFESVLMCPPLPTCAKFSSETRITITNLRRSIPSCPT